MPLKALSTSSASPSSTFYYPYPHCSYPPLQRPCHPSFLFCVLNLFAVLIPTASSTPPVHTIISFLIGCLFQFPYNNSSLLTSDKNLLNHSLPPSTQLQPVCILPGIYYMLSFSYSLASIHHCSHHCNFIKASCCFLLFLSQHSLTQLTFGIISPPGVSFTHQLHYLYT